MTNLWPILKRDKAGEPAGGGAPPATPPIEQPPAAGDPPAKAPGSGPELDDFGYEKTPASGATKEEGAEKPPGDKPPEAAPEKVEEITDPATGYLGDPPKADPPAAPVPPAPPGPPDELDKVLEGIPKEDVARIKAIAVKNKLSPEVAKDLGDAVKEVAALNLKAAKDMEAKIAQDRKARDAGWHKELKEDKTFSGEKGDKFLINASKAEKALAEVLPSFKKALTENKGMLSPNNMRDLLALAEKLHPREQFIQGDPPPPPEKPEEKDPHAFLNDMYK